MKKNNTLLNIQEVCKFYGLSIQTIRRRIREAKQGTGSFPAPIFGYGRKALWHKTDIENWKESEPQQTSQDR